MKNSIEKRLILASNRLPFTIRKEEGQTSIQESDGGLVSALKSYLDAAGGGESASTVWIGSAEFSELQWKKLDNSKTAALSYKVEPIFIDKKLYHPYYNGFCNATLWPLFHYFPSYVEYNEETFVAYEQVNRLFADRILENATADDVIWIHDYQLMLVPAMIRKELPDAQIGFFLHIPFPSFDIFRVLHGRWKRTLIEGLLGADVIGFHTYEYVQHFLRSVQMMLGYEHKCRTVYLPERVVKVDMFPLGVDYQKFNDAASLPDVREKCETIRSNFHGQKILFSVDRLDYTKGITHRLAGFERFLEKFPEWKGNVVFVMVVVPSRQIVSKYNERKKMIEEEIGRINGKYSTLGWQPILYRYSYMSFPDLVAMYNASDAGLLTPLRDGMNLVAKEYLASKTDQGVLILSELAGAANELSEAILVNPLDPEEVSQAVHTALVMDPELQRKNLSSLQSRLKRYTVNHWFDGFIQAMRSSKNQQQYFESEPVSSEVIQQFTYAFRGADRRLLLLDYDGTLAPYTNRPECAVPSQQVIDLLIQLSIDERTDVTIISGRDSDTLQEWFGHLNLSLVAEHGAGVRIRGGAWRYNQPLDEQWRSTITAMLEVFVQRTPGATIEQKRNAMVWHYRNVADSLAFIRSRELLDNLYHLTANSALNILDGNKAIEIRLSGVDKGSIAREMLQAHDYTFVLAIGDDKTDEDMFRSLSDVQYTIRVGTGNTLAHYHMQDFNDVIGLLDHLLH